MSSESHAGDMPRWVASTLDSYVTWVLARIALTLPFWWSGIDKGLHPHAALEEICVLLGTTSPLPAYVLLLIVQIGGSLLVILNRFAWLGAGALGVFTIAVTVLAHAFWKLHGPAQFAEMNTFLEHVALVAAFAFAAMTARHRPGNPLRTPLV